MDFSLARFWRHGADCITRTRRTAARGAADVLGTGLASSLAGLESSLTGAGLDSKLGGGGLESSLGGLGSIGRDGEGDADWRSFVNNSHFARRLRGAGEAALSASALSEQCPRAIAAGEAVTCPWHSHACSERQAATLAMAEGAGRFQASAALPPRQLIGAERCLTETCLRYEGTARRRRGKPPSSRPRPQEAS